MQWKLVGTQSPRAEAEGQPSREGFVHLLMAHGAGTAASPLLGQDLCQQGFLCQGKISQFSVFPPLRRQDEMPTNLKHQSFHLLTTLPSTL